MSERAGGSEGVALSEAGQATRGSAIKLGAESAGRVVAVLTTLLIARGLGVGEFGVFSALSGLAVVFAEASDCGLQGTASRELVAGSMSLGAMLRAKLVLTVGVLSALAIGPLLQTVLAPLVGDPGDSPAGTLHVALRSMPLFAPLVVYFVCAGWSEFLGVILRSRGERAREAAVILTQRLVGLVLVALVLRSGRGLLALAWVLAASPIPALGLGGVLLSSGKRGPDVEPQITGVLPVLRRSLPLAVNGGLALVSLKVELLALAFLRGATQAGLFAAALKVVEFLNLVPSAIAGGAMPFLTREGLRGSGLVRQRTASTLGLLGAPAAVGLALVAPGLIALLYGPEFAGAAPALRILALSVLPLFMNTVLLYSLVAVGRASLLPRLTAVRVVSAVGLASVLIPSYGAAGAAAGFLLSELGLLALASRACASAGFSVPVVRPLAVGLAASIPMGACVAFFGPGAIAQTGVGVLVYAVTLASAFRLRPSLVRP